MKDQSKVIVALLAGVAAGAILGLLLAPDSGKESRGKIADLANDLADKVMPGSKALHSEEDPEKALGI